MYRTLQGHLSCCVFLHATWNLRSGNSPVVSQGPGLSSPLHPLTKERWGG